MNTNAEMITMSRASLGRLLDALNPNPDDGGGRGPWGPFGPGGPVIRHYLEKILWAALNPQPLPPGPHPDPWRVFERVSLNPQPLPPMLDPWAAWQWATLNPQPLPPGPQPDPWRSAFAARAVIERAVLLEQLAEAMGGQHSGHGSGRLVITFVDDYCGNHPPRWPFPWPGPDPRKLNFMDLLIAGAQFERAAGAMAEGALRNEFSTAAGRLMEKGMEMLEQAG